MKMNRNEKGRFIPAKAAEMIGTAHALQVEAEKLIQAENNQPQWLKNLIVVIAKELGVTTEDFAARVKIHHPTPADPVLLIDCKAYIAWI